MESRDKQEHLKTLSREHSCHSRVGGLEWAIRSALAGQTRLGSRHSAAQPSECRIDLAPARLKLPTILFLLY